VRANISLFDYIEEVDGMSGVLLKKMMAQTLDGFS